MKALGEICQIKQGKYLSPAEMSEAPTPEKSIPVVGGNGILGYTDRPSHTTDVALITCRGSKCGLIQWVEAPVWVSNNAMACNTGTLLGNKFLRYLFGSTDFEDVITGSAQPQITMGHLSKKEFSVCSESEWPSIVEMLGTLDDRITLLRETNTTLEAIAQALFNSWFVDFDPVHAKMQGRAPEGIDETTAALFPVSFEESKLGPVPKGWQVKSLDAVASFLNGLALQKFPPTGDDDLPVIKIAQLRKGDTVGADLASRSIKSEYIIQNGDVLFSWSGSLEVEIWCGGEGALNQHLFKVTSDVFPKWFYFLWTRYHLEHFRQVAASKATTMGHIQRAHLTDAKVLVPCEEVLRAANSLLAPIMQRVIENSLQAYNFAALRDTLLPRLISGQLQIKEVTEVLQ